MPSNEMLFHKYEQLLPSKFEGGLLVFVLYEKINAGELDTNFSTADIKTALTEISARHHIEVPRIERIIKPLLNYFLRNLADQPGQYYLTDYAENLVEMVKRKFDNPYKSLKLKESFEKYFSIRNHEIQSVDDMERKFGREFIAGHKNIIRHHLDSLEDEMQETYKQLKDILHAEEGDATKMVSKFAITFKKFGERAEDINHAIAEKDRFLRDLRRIVDSFYNDYTNSPIPITELGQMEREKLGIGWRKSSAIYREVELFFQGIDQKITNINRQIYYASEKLTELQENFSSRAKMKLAVKLMFKLSLDYAVPVGDEILFDEKFPIRGYVSEPLRFFSPGKHEFIPDRKSTVIEQEDDPAYVQDVMTEINKEMDREEKVHKWIEIGKKLLIEQSISIDSFMREIIKIEGDLLIAYRVASEITGFASEDLNYEISIERKLTALEDEDLYLWKTNLEKQADTNF